MTKTLRPGVLAYDLTQHEPIVIVEPDIGTVDEQDDAMRERIEKSQGNQAVGVGPKTRCATVTYLDMQSTNDRTYTFPITRIGVPNVKAGEYDFTPPELAQFNALYQLLAEAIRDGEADVGKLNELWRNTPLPNDVLNAAMNAADQDLSSYSDSDDSGSDS